VRVKDLTGLMAELLSRRERAGREIPMLVLTGSRGCGKTSALEKLVPVLDQHVPYALVDCDNTKAETGELLSTLAFELNYKCGPYGRLAFPRLITGLLVIPLRLDTSNPGRARKQVEQVLEQYRRIDQLRQFVKTLAGSTIQVLRPAASGPGADAAVSYGTDLLIDGLVTGRIGRKVMLGPGQDWFGHQDRDLKRDPLDALVDLNRRAAAPEAGSNKRLVAELLWAAFLADLHHNFARKPDWDLNCAVLLDNVDSPVGSRFLEELGDARKVRRAASPRDDTDPVTIVATSRGAIPARVLAAGADPVPLAEASYASYERLVAAGRVERGWYPVQLPDLTEAQIANLVAACELRGATNERISPVLFSFTRGHARSTYHLIDALPRSADPGDLATVLGSPARPGAKQEPAAPGQADPAGQEPVTTGEQLLSLLVSGVGEGTFRDLVLCAAARDLDDASALATDAALLTGPRGGQRAIFAMELWVAGPAGADVMLPVLRHLLLRQLAADPGRWQGTCSWLRGHRADAGDAEGELYYALALGEVQPVVRHLSGQLGQIDILAWLGFLNAVTAAPADRPVPGVPDLAELASWARPQDMPRNAIATLVAALWQVSNSLSAHERQELYAEAGASLDLLVPYGGGGRKVLRAEAQKYHRLSGGSLLATSARKCPVVVAGPVAGQGKGQTRQAGTVRRRESNRPPSGRPGNGPAGGGGGCGGSPPVPGRSRCSPWRAHSSP
jgi:hypothetical protein